MKKNLTGKIVLAAMAVIILGGCQSNPAAVSKDVSGKDMYTIKFAMTQGGVSAEDSGEVKYIETFQKEVEEKSGGRLKVEVYPNGQLGSAEEFTRGIIAGNIEMTAVNVNVLNNLFKDSMLLSSPGIFSSEEECDAILNGEWGESFFRKMEDSTGIRMLSSVCNGFRCFTSSNKELTTVDTAKGVTFRVMQSPVSIKMVESLGAKAVPMAGSEMYTAMQNGTVDGQENPVVNIINDKTYEVQKYLVMDKHMASIVCFVMSDKFYNSLPEDLQKIVDEAAVNAAAGSARTFAAINQEGMTELEEAGMIIYEPAEQELIAWHDTVSVPCQEYIRGEIGDDPVDSILKAVEEYRAGK